MPNRCELTELLPEQCACPRHRNVTLPTDHRPDDHAEPGPRGPWFNAGYPGRCSRCDAPFNPGDRIRADGNNGYLAACCGEDDTHG